MRGIELNPLHLSTIDQAVFQDWAELWSQKHTQPNNGETSVNISLTDVGVFVPDL